MIDGDALEELFRETIGHIAKMPEIDGALEHMVRASAMAVEMIQDAPTITPETGWISVKDRLPPNDPNVKVLTYGNPVVTHWMPLPEPPKEET